MCISVAPAILAKTTIYCAEVMKDNEIYHVMAYQNSSKNIANVPNAMILPIPTNDYIGPGNMIEGSKYSSIMKHYNASIVSYTDRRYKGLSRGIGALTNSRSFQIFEKGSYTVVLATGADNIIEALKYIPKNKHPNISNEMIEFFDETYKGWPIAICCFNNLKESENEPLIWYYKPKYNYLFAPGIDAHNGKIPDLKSDIQRDHVLAFSALNIDEGINCYFSDKGEHDWLFSRKIKGINLQKATKNEDFIINIDEIKNANSILEYNNFVH